ncbi:MAG: 4-(cytidine 5'-diphospho)-2-C-methyl-D-erythritol kinase, partial [SAR202 cluster bacterium]
MNTLKLLSPAKINLTLEIINKRSDDFHNIISLVTDISLTDELFFTASDQINFESNVELEENSNSILKTIFLIKNKFQLDNGIAVKLVKNIPLSSGLGGGSSNAATTLIALNKLWELNLNTSDLIYLGSKIGSDVPYFIQKGL